MIVNLVREDSAGGGPLGADVSSPQAGADSPDATRVKQDCLNTKNVFSFWYMCLVDCYWFSCVYIYIYTYII